MICCINLPNFRAGWWRKKNEIKDDEIFAGISKNGFFISFIYTTACVCACCTNIMRISVELMILCMDDDDDGTKDKVDFSFLFLIYKRFHSIIMFTLIRILFVQAWITFLFSIEPTFQ